MLEKLVSLHSVSGGEQRLAHWMKGQLEPYADRVEIDRVGNLIARKGISSQIAVFAHMDTVGYMVKKVENGLVEVVPVGRPSHAHGVRVLVLAQTEEIESVLIEKGAEDKKTLYVDTGMPAPEKVIHIGDLITYAPRYTR